MLFPVLRDYRLIREFPNCPAFIDWEIIRPHEKQAMKNHYQSLARLAERGGLSPAELYAVLHDKEYEHMPNQDAVEFVYGLTSP